jgi:hypothetical protein
MSRAAAQAAAAAENLAAWLGAQRETAARQQSVAEADPAQVPAPAADPAGGNGMTTCASDVPPEQATSDQPITMEPLAAAGGLSLKAAMAVTPDVLALAHTDWLFHHLEIRGPAADLQAFRLAACGAGTIPWQLDLDALRDDIFHLLAAPPVPQSRSLSAAGARILAEELSVAVARRQEVATSRVGVSHACAFDLHALLPVPPDILRHGPDHSAALTWLWTNWGTTHPLRHVTLLAKPGERERLELRFWSADWTPWPAIAAVRARWPTLHLDVRPQYGAT